MSRAFLRRPRLALGFRLPDRTITVDAGRCRHPDIHMYASDQGFRVARMASCTELG